MEPKLTLLKALEVSLASHPEHLAIDADDDFRIRKPGNSDLYVRVGFWGLYIDVIPQYHENTRIYLWEYPDEVRNIAKLINTRRAEIIDEANKIRILSTAASLLTKEQLGDLSLSDKSYKAFIRPRPPQFPPKPRNT